MTQISQSIETIIGDIGKTRFWLGVLVGLLYSSSLSVSLVLGRRLWFHMMPYFGATVSDHDNISNYYDYWLIFLSLTIGVSFMIKFWCEGLLKNTGRKKRYGMLCYNINLIQTWVVPALFIEVGRLSLLLSMNTSSGSTDPLNVWTDYHWTLNMIPIVIYLNSWIGLSQIYRCTRWMIIIAATLVVVGSTVIYLI